MIPFARIIKYGNNIPTDNIKKIVCSTTNSVFVLTESGELYGFGNNTNGELGTGNKDRILNVIHIDSGVGDVWAGAGFSIYKKGLEFFSAGYGSFYGSSAVESLTFINITFLFSSLNILNIQKIELTTALFILMQNGDLYGSGVNTGGQFGTGALASARYATPTLTQSGVMDFNIIGNGSIILKSDGFMYSAGANGNGQLGSTTVTTVLTYTQISKFPNVTNFGSFGSTSITTLFKDSDGKTWISGNSYGVDNPAVATTLFSKEAILPEGVFRFISTRASANTPIICTTSGYYFAGTNPYGAYGNGQNVTATVFTRMDSMDNYISDYSKVPIMDGCFYGTYFAVGDRLYGAGNGNTGNVPGYTGTQRNYVEIKLKGN